MDLLLNHFWELTITGLAIGAVYALVALGYTLVYGVLRLINFAHSEVFMWGSFAAVWVLMAVGAGKATGHRPGRVSCSSASWLRWRSRRSWPSSSSSWPTARCASATLPR